MTTKTQRETMTFNRPFSLKAAGRTLPAGAYEVISEEELIEGLSFLAYRRISTVIMVPGALRNNNFTEMLTVDWKELEALVRNDQAADRRDITQK